jgi:hypothetical protein
VFESPCSPVAAGEIDRIVFAKLASLNIQPAPCSDAVFVRRAYLDVIGTLPTAQEARNFINAPNTNSKRQALIDELLQRDEFAVYWAMKWGDILRIKAEAPVNLWPNATQAYHRWVRASIAENKPYDQFVRELLTSSGSSFRVGPANFYRAIPDRTPEGIAGAVALTFMGCRVDSWPNDRLAGMSVFFSQVGYKPTSEWKEEIVFWDPLRLSQIPGNAAPGTPDPASPPTQAKAGRTSFQKAAPLTAVFPDGKMTQLSPDQDPRKVFADWLIASENSWFANAIVNRVWAWLLGRGIIHPPDDMRENNPPSNPALLAYLAREWCDHHYDLKHVYRLILSSEAYQLSSVPRFSTPQAKASFASYPLRRLEAEVLLDAINQITGQSELFTSAIPEPYTNMFRDNPVIVEDLRDKRAVALADGSISNSFLTMFGRSARAAGTMTERSNETDRSQWMQMLNSTWVQAKRR